MSGDDDRMKVARSILEPIVDQAMFDGDPLERVRATAEESIRLYERGRGVLMSDDQKRDVRTTTAIGRIEYLLWEACHVAKAARENAHTGFHQNPSKSTEADDVHNAVVTAIKLVRLARVDRQEADARAAEQEKKKRENKKE